MAEEAVNHAKEAVNHELGVLDPAKCESWTRDDLAFYLLDCDFEDEVTLKLMEAEVTGERFIQLTDAELIDLKIADDPRLRLLKEITKLQCRHAALIGSLNDLPRFGLCTSHPEASYPLEFYSSSTDKLLCAECCKNQLLTNQRNPRQLSQIGREKLETTFQLELSSLCDSLRFLSEHSERIMLECSRAKDRANNDATISLGRLKDIKRRLIETVERLFEETHNNILDRNARNQATLSHSAENALSFRKKCVELQTDISTHLLTQSETLGQLLQSRNTLAQNARHIISEARALSLDHIPSALIDFDENLEDEISERLQELFHDYSFDGTDVNGIVSDIRVVPEHELPSSLNLPMSPAKVFYEEQENGVFLLGWNRGVSAGQIFRSDLSEWNEAPQAMYPRRESPVVGYVPAAQTIIVAGGLIWDKASKKCEFWDLHTMKWEKLSTMKIPRFASSGICLSDERTFLVCGGNDGKKRLNSCEVLRFGAERWEQFPDLPVSVNHHACVLYMSKPLVIGGYVGHVTSQCFYFDGTASWGNFPSLSTARQLIGAATLEDRIFVVGGYNEDQGTLTTMEVFDGTLWSIIPEHLPSPRVACCALPYGEKVLILGGEREGHVLTLDSTTRALSQCENIPRLRGAPLDKRNFQFCAVSFHFFE